MGKWEQDQKSVLEGRYQEPKLVDRGSTWLSPVVSIG